LLGHKQDAGDLVFNALWMRLRAHFHIQEAVTVLEQRLMILIALPILLADQ
jgi:hypothetical protein